MKTILEAMNNLKEDSYSYKDELAGYKEKYPELYNVFEQLKRLEKSDDTLYMSELPFKEGCVINVIFNTGNDHQLHGGIFSNKTCQLTTASGPNPLDPSFLDLLNKVAKILDGYTMLPY